MKAQIEKKRIKSLCRQQLRRNRGATSIEYAILGSLIAAVIVLVVSNLGSQVRLLFETVSAAW
ncbi:MAG TPA: Flp family type IVb pilin [Syntrophales bacterium]|nr:Flp family type IVb pilin [Syntrophales bacterium]